MQVSSFDECEVTDLTFVVGVEYLESAALASPTMEGNVDPLRSVSLNSRISDSNLLLAVNKCLTDSFLISNSSSPAIATSPISLINSLYKSLAEIQHSRTLDLLMIGIILSHTHNTR